jgi:hypothetical protein
VSFVVKGGAEAHQVLADEFLPVTPAEAIGEMADGEYYIIQARIKYRDERYYFKILIRRK